MEPVKRRLPLILDQIPGTEVTKDTGGTWEGALRIRDCASVRATPAAQERAKPVRRPVGVWSELPRKTKREQTQKFSQGKESLK